jgi:hypothetical protein
MRRRTDSVATSAIYSTINPNPPAGGHVRHFGRARLLAVIAVTAIPCSTALAHTFKPDRELVVQLDTRGAAALWQLTVGGGPAMVLFANGDLDHDGTLSEGERVALSLSLLSKAVGGVVVTWDGLALRRTNLKPRLEAADRLLVALGLAELEIPHGVGHCGEHRLAVELEAKAAPLGVDIRALDAWRVIGVAARPTRAQEQPGEPLVLDPKERLEVRVIDGACTTQGAQR